MYNSKSAMSDAGVATVAAEIAMTSEAGGSEGERSNRSATAAWFHDKKKHITPIRVIVLICLTAFLTTSIKMIEIISQLARDLANNEEVMKTMNNYLELSYRAVVNVDGGGGDDDEDGVRLTREEQGAWGNHSI